jgi:6-hydroxycyclohex-1-ene-1-carbonyl-CoA dehydrogenase
VNAQGKSASDVKKEVRGITKENALPGYSWRVFETSGTGPGQHTAFALLSFAGTLGVVGFTMDKVDIRLSNVMAFDADVFGNWACKPEHYPTVVEDILAGRVNVQRGSREGP